MINSIKHVGNKVIGPFLADSTRTAYRSLQVSMSNSTFYAVLISVIPMFMQFWFQWFQCLCSSDSMQIQCLCSSDSMQIQFQWFQIFSDSMQFWFQWFQIVCNFMMFYEILINLWFMWFWNRKKQMKMYWNHTKLQKTGTIICGFMQFFMIICGLIPNFMRLHAVPIPAIPKCYAVPCSSDTLWF